MMLYYKEKNSGSVYAFESSEDAEKFGPPGLVEMTDDEISEHLNPPGPPEPTQLELDLKRYQRRAASKDELISWMAADNMQRVRAGTWTVADLQALLVELAPINAMMQTLSFELAAQAITAVQSPLLTQDIKSAWVAKLAENFYVD